MLPVASSFASTSPMSFLGKTEIKLLKKQIPHHQRIIIIITVYLCKISHKELLLLAKLVGKRRNVHHQKFSVVVSARRIFEKYLEAQLLQY
jgi:hypothetical protein